MYDVIMLQETQSTVQDEIKWQSEWGGKIVFSHGKKDARGVMILFKGNTDIDITEVKSDGDGRMLIVTVTLINTQMVLVNIYAPNEDKPDFFHHVFNETSQLDIPNMAIGGDYNLVLDWSIDKHGGLQKTNANSQACVKQYMDTLELIDVWRVKHPNLKEYTWRRRKPCIIQCRLDFFLVSQSVLQMTKAAKIGSSYLSDHSIVVIELTVEKQSRGPGYWKLNCALLQDKDYVESINEVIRECENEYSRLQVDKVLFWEVLKMKIRGASIKFSSCKKRIDRNAVTELDSKIRLLEHKENITTDECEELEKYKAEVNSIINRKVEGDIVRSRAKVYEEGEKSSKYFLTLEKSNQVKKTLYHLKVEGQDQLISNHANLCNYIREYYENLYKAVEVESIEDLENEFFSNVTTRLTDEEKNSCEGHLSKQELLLVLKQTANNKSPGIDGIPPEFYKVFWHNISDHLVNAMNEAYNKGELSVNHRRGIVSLVPKKGKDTMFIKNWRPITLLCADYKLASKAIAYRIRPHLIKLINSDQNGFVKNRYIGQNIDLLHQIIEYSEESKIPGIVLAVDYEKAFDKLNWGFINHVLQLYNFGTMLQKWVSLFYTNVTSCINVNGWFTKPFDLHRGVKQGDPLSTSLFILCAEVLAENMRKNEDIKGIIIGDTEHKISMFADDTNVFLRYCVNSLNAVLSMLDKFAVLSGLKINYEKSVAYNIGVKRDKLKTKYSIKWSTDVIETLGIKIPLYANKQNMYTINYGPRITAMENTIKTWSMRNLSLRGKVVVIKALLISKFQYLVSVFGKPDRPIIRKIDKLVYNFLWQGSEKVKRKIIMNTRDNGGLNVPDFETVCEVAMFKWIHRYLHCDVSCKWKQMVNYSLRHVGKEFVFNCNLSSTEGVIDSIKSSLWKSIVKRWCDIMYKKKAYLESDDILWLNSNFEVPLYNQDCINNGLLYVKDMYKANTLMCYTDLCAEYHIKLNVIDYNTICHTIRTKYRTQMLQSELNDTECDVECSKSMAAMMYNVNVKQLGKKLYSLLIKRKAECYSFTDKWPSVSEQVEGVQTLFTSIDKISIESKLRSFQFKFLHKIVFFNDRLFKCKLATTTLCDFCHEALDSIEHRYFYCRITQAFWWEIETWLEREYNVKCNVNDIKLIVTNMSDTRPLVDLSILNAKYYIYRCFLQKTEPTISSFKGLMCDIERTEWYIASQRNLLHVHNEKWRK